MKSEFRKSWFPARGTIRRGAAIVLVFAFLSLLVSGAFFPEREHFWEVWHDLNQIAELPQGARSELRSSYCPSGCRFDRHSADDWRYLRVDGEEGVIFEDTGAGVITRFWMTMGQGTSQPLAPGVRMRIYIDGHADPIVDEALPALFDGSRPPFVAPLVGNRRDSSGGNFSYVPIPYRKGCRITFTGAHEERIWYQFNYYRVSRPQVIDSFTGDENLDAWASLLDVNGGDPWTAANGLSPDSVWRHGAFSLEPGDTLELADLEGPDSITALRLELPESEWGSVDIIMNFEGETRVSMPVRDFFAAGRGRDESSRSLLLGVDEHGRLYSYFPMPFFEHAGIQLRNTGNDAPVAVKYAFRRSARTPSSASAQFGAQRFEDPETPTGLDIPLLVLRGSGKWAGLFAELGSVETKRRGYLEGDERVYIDHDPYPTLHGTGTEDFFSGGFYFDQGNFVKALHGSPYHFISDEEDFTGMYRLMLSDAVNFEHAIRAGLEGGPTSNLRVRARTVAYYYLRAGERDRY